MPSNMSEFFNNCIVFLTSPQPPRPVVERNKHSSYGNWLIHENFSICLLNNLARYVGKELVMGSLVAIQLFLLVLDVCLLFGNATEVATCLEI